MKAPYFYQGAVSDEPVITSLLDLDFYKLSMGQFIFLNYPTTEVRFTFMNRGKQRLADVIPAAALRRELDHVMGLKFDFTEVSYLRGLNNYGDRLLKEPYLEFLRTLRMPQYRLEYRPDGHIDLSFEAAWPAVSNWEIYVMRIVNELYFRELMRKKTPFERESVYIEGKKRLQVKLGILNENPNVFFSNFGCRRCFSGEWASYVDWAFKSGLDNPKQFRGTSSVLLAKEHGLEPIGTNAHETQMVLAALANSDEELAAAPHKFLDQWWDLYGSALAVILPDTFGSRYMMRTLSQENAERYRGIRLDSSDPHIEGEEWVDFWKGRGLDPMKKFLIPSDELNPTSVLALHNKFSGRVPTSFGWGTNLTNDLGLESLKIVAKVTHADGRPVVKLSNIPGKASGPVEQIERYRRVFGYSQD